METENLQIFLAVVKRAGFAPVARDLDVDPSSISRAVATLEAELGVRLFQRSTRRLALTEAGETFLSRVAPAVEELERAREEARSLNAEPSGKLRITASVAFGQICLVPALPAYRRAFPGIQLELLLTDTVLDLTTERIDLAIRLAPSLSGDIVCTRLFSTRYRVVASPAYLAREGAPKTPAQLSAHSCLLFPMPEFRERWRFRKAGLTEEVKVHGELLLSTALALRSAARDGLGPVLLANWHLDEDLASGRLVDLFPDYEVTATTFETAAWLLYPSRSFLPHKVRATIQFLREHLGHLAPQNALEAGKKPRRSKR